MTTSLEELLDHISQNFYGYCRKRDGPFRRLGLDAMLQREDTRFGCHLPVNLFTRNSQVWLEIRRDTHDGEVFENGSEQDRNSQPDVAVEGLSSCVERPPMKEGNNALAKEKLLPDFGSSHD